MQPYGLSHTNFLQVLTTTTTSSSSSSTFSSTFSSSSSSDVYGKEGSECRLTAFFLQGVWRGGGGFGGSGSSGSSPTTTTTTTTSSGSCDVHDIVRTARYINQLQRRHLGAVIVVVIVVVVVRMVMVDVDKRSICFYIFYRWWEGGRCCARCCWRAGVRPYVALMRRQGERVPFQ